MLEIKKKISTECYACSVNYVDISRISRSPIMLRQQVLFTVLFNPVSTFMIMIPHVDTGTKRAFSDSRTQLGKGFSTSFAPIR